MKITIVLLLICDVIFMNRGIEDHNLKSITQSPDQAGINLIINNIRNQTGYIQVNVFDSETGYPEKSQFKFTLSKDTIKSGVLRLHIPLMRPGTFGITVLDDENKNEKMDFVFGIKPKEGFGFSNNPKVPGRKPPKFSETMIKYNGGRMVIVINMKYV